MAELTSGLEKIPNTLKLLMGQLLNANTLNSWNIYENRSGVVTVNIRFIQDSQEHFEPVSFRRINAKQMNRNRQRVQTYQNSSSNSPTAVAKKRKMCDTSPEINRMNLSAASHYVDTPEVIETSAALTSSPTLVSPLAIISPPDQFRPPAHVLMAPSALVSMVEAVNTEDISVITPPAVEILDISIPDYHTTQDIGPLTTYTISPTVVTPVDYHTATYTPELVILDDATHINIDSCSVANSLAPSCEVSNGNDNEETLIKDSNVIYCQCCSSVMSVTHVCSIENDPPSPTPLNEIPPEPGPPQIFTPCDVVDSGDPQPDVKDPKLLEILCSVIGKWKK